jgi:hypothetical protein
MNVKKIVLLALSFTFYSHILPAQSNDKWRAGSAYALTGKVYILSAFIGSETEDWTKEEKDKVFALQREACTFIQKQAKNYKENVSFQEGTFGYDKTLYFDELPSGQGSGKEPVDWVGRVLKKAGYKNNLDFSNWVKKNTTCTNSIVLIYLNKSGVSYALPASTEMNQELYFNEGCLVYSYYDTAKKKPLCAATIAHEMLHTFGAWDLYTTFAQSNDREKKARTIYPNDIMLRTSYNINELEIGKLTAWLVGWKLKEEEDFEWFRPKGY